MIIIYISRKQQKEMNKKRMSDRKSELRLNIQDFCLGLPQNSDPVIGYLLTILQWEASLDVETNSILHKAFVNQIQQLKCKLRMELKHTKDKGDGLETHNNNITKLINQFHKLKQLFSYCLILSKKKSQLCKQLEKFNQYIPKQPNLTEELQNYLNQPIIFQTIFHSYLRVYNVNVLTADLISFLYAEHQQKLLLHSKEQNVIFKKWSNPDIQLLKNQTIIFKQLTDMNKKYVVLTQKLKNSYIFQLCNDPSQILDVSQAGQQEIRGEQENILKEKVKKLEQILKKIKKQPGLYDDEKSVSIVMEIEPLCNFSALQIVHDYQGWRMIQSNKQFFLETLYGKSWSENVLGDQQFSFMREKIIKVETLFFLNRVLSAMNVISYIYNQLDLEVRNNYEFQFKNLRKLIGSQFISKDMYEYKVSSSCHRSAFVSIDSNVQAYNIIDSQNMKILYPSTVNYFFCFIKNMLSTSFPDKEGLLQILEAKSEYMERLGQTITNIYQIIKVKQLSCYKLLREYIQIILKSSCWNNLGSYQNYEQIIKTVEKQKQKIGIISQIIYEFDHNYSIKQPLQELIRIQFEGLTKNCASTFKLYKSILFQIIQIRNGLKLDHYYSVNQIHQTFSLIPTDIEKMDEHKKGKHQDLYFQDIIHQICTASHTNLYLPRLFFFLDLQLKFKRIVFKLELCWSCSRQSMFERKTQAFKDFINAYCSPIFEIVNQCHTIVQILEKIQQIERYIDIFSKQVSRFHLIEKLVSIIRYYAHRVQIQSIRQHISRLSLDKLEELNTLMSIFNPIESHKESNRVKFLQGLAKNIQTFSAIRVDEMKNFNSTFIKQKQKLAGIIVLLHTISARNQSKDHVDLIQLHKDGKISYDLYQLKQNQAMLIQYEEWLKSDNMQSLIKYNEDLIVLSILKTLRQMEEEFLDSCQDYNQLKKLMNKFELSSIFTNLESILEIQFWRSEIGIMTKYHQIYQLMFHFDRFNTKVYGNQAKKAQYKDKKMLNLQDHTVNFSYERSDFVTKLYYLFQVSALTRMKLQKNLQFLQNQILQTQSVHRKSVYYRQKLKKTIYTMFCQQIDKIIQKSNIIQQIKMKFDGSKQPSQYVDQLRKKMLNSVSSQYACDLKQEGFGYFRQIEMFREKRGYELPILETKQNKQYKIGANKKYTQRSKKPIISPHKIQQEKTKPLQDLKRKFKIEMLKKSIHVRKQISKLQLSQNKIRDEIVWETSKLEHSVVDKINQFITLSNVDQQQSYLNFKHTVNLETIKGIQNVIEEQTEMYMQKKNAPVQIQDAFITGVANEQQGETQKVDNKSTLLDANVESILQHMKKIKIFSAWKKIMKKTDSTKKQWCNFNSNVQNILNNDKIVQSLLQIEDSRNNYLRQNVTCEIMKQQNMRINEKIQQLKIDNLQRKVRGYRQHLLKD